MLFFCKFPKQNHRPERCSLPNLHPHCSLQGLEDHLTTTPTRSLRRRRLDNGWCPLREVYSGDLFADVPICHLIFSPWPIFKRLVKDYIIFSSKINLKFQLWLPFADSTWNLQKELLSEVYSPRERFVHSPPKRVPAGKSSTQMWRDMWSFSGGYSGVQHSKIWEVHLLGASREIIITFFLSKRFLFVLNNAGFMLLMIACRTSVHLPLLGKTVVTMGVRGDLSWWCLYAIK